MPEEHFQQEPLGVVPAVSMGERMGWRVSRRNCEDDCKQEEVRLANLVNGRLAKHVCRHNGTIRMIVVGITSAWVSRKVERRLLQGS